MDRLALFLNKNYGCVVNRAYSFENGTRIFRYKYNIDTRKYEIAEIVEVVKPYNSYKFNLLRGIMKERL